MEIDSYVVNPLDIAKDDDLIYICEFLDIEDLIKFALINKRVFNICKGLIDERIERIEKEKKDLPGKIYNSIRNGKMVTLNLNRKNGDKVEFEVYLDRGIASFSLDEYVDNIQQPSAWRRSRYDPKGRSQSLIMEWKKEFNSDIKPMTEKVGSKFHMLGRWFHFDYELKEYINKISNMLTHANYCFKSISIIPKPSLHDLHERDLKINKNWGIRNS